MAINDSTLDTDVYTAVRNIIVAAAPYVTNSATGSTVAAGIESVYNDKKTNKPQVIINPVENSEDNWRFGGTEGKKLINVFVDCYFTRGDGVDQVCQQIKTAVKGTNFDGMDLIGVTTNYAFPLNHENKLHLKTITFNFDRE